MGANGTQLARIAGLEFSVPVGLTAGFDKSARAVPFLSSLCLGHVEVGSISADASVAPFATLQGIDTFLAAVESQRVAFDARSTDRQLAH